MGNCHTKLIATGYIPQDSQYSGNGRLSYQINSDRGFERLGGNYGSFVCIVPVTGLDLEMVIDYVKRRNMEFKILINAGEFHILTTLMPL